MPSLSSLVVAPRGPALGRRFFNLLTGLVIFGFGVGLMLHSDLGVPPWDVLHQGLSKHFGLTVGIWSVIVSLVVLIGWLPLRERFGVGTILNAVVIGLVIDASALVLPDPEGMTHRILMLAAGILAIGFASGLYIGAGLGPGPRDGLMTGIARRGPSIRATRTVIEVVVLAAGWALGGTFGVGTVVFALSMGPLVQFFLPRFLVLPRPITSEVEAR